MTLSDLCARLGDIIDPPDRPHPDPTPLLHYAIRELRRATQGERSVTEAAQEAKAAIDLARERLAARRREVHHDV